MKAGDLIVFRPKSGSIHDTMISLLIKKTSSVSLAGTFYVLFDVIFEDEIITISDVYFEISKLQEKV